MICRNLLWTEPCKQSSKIRSGSCFKWRVIFKSTKKSGTQAKRIRGDPANAGAGEATAPSEWWGDNLFFCRRWDPRFFVLLRYQYPSDISRLASFLQSSSYTSERLRSSSLRVLGNGMLRQKIPRTSLSRR